MIKRIVALLVFMCSVLVESYAQPAAAGYFELETKRNNSLKMDFELYNNLVVIPVIINSSRDTLKMILDTGVARTLITGLPNGEVVNLNFTRRVKVEGLGEGEAIEAFYSNGNEVIINRTTGHDQEVLVLVEDIFNLSTLLGTYVHGLIGYSVFQDFIVEIDYRYRWIKFHDYEKFRSKFNKKKRSSGWEEVPLIIRDGKPYVNATITQQDGSKVEVTLLIDTGASKAISLYHSANDDIFVPEKKVRSFLGNGLSGEINGYLGLIKEIQIGKYTLTEPVTTYPDEEGIKRALVFSDRDGSIGAELMRRFKVMFNYRDSTMLIQPSRFFNDEFSYNKSGIEIATPFPNIQLYQVTHVREGSIADRSGILEGDFITEINGKSSSEYTLNEALNIFTKGSVERLRLKLVRNDSSFRKQLDLENELK
ncbi:MAG: aspartate aminotransferase [Balneola sp.]|nr:MAG: aspartate aminotransferase [Balneola sp.]